MTAFDLAQRFVGRRYRFVARAVAGAIKSDNSAPSAEWERAPGPPSRLIVR